MSNTDKVIYKLDQLLNVNLRMEKLLEKKEKGGEGKEKKETSSSEGDDSVKKLSSLSSSMADLVKALSSAKLPDPGKGKQLAKFVVNFAEGIESVIKKLDEKKTEEFTKLLDVMLKGASRFVVQMALTAILTPIAMIGIAGFGLGVLLLTKILTHASKVDEESMKGIKSLLGMGKGIAIFMLVMIGLSFVGPIVAKGFLVFFMVVTGLAVTLRIVDMIAGGGIGPFKDSPLGSLAKLARGIALFTLTLILLNLTAPLIAQGFLVFALVVTGIAIVLKIVSVIAGGGINPTDSGPLGDLAKLGMGVAMFAVTFVLITFVKERFLMGALIMLLAITAFGLVLVGLSKMLKTGDKPLSTKGQFDTKEAITGADSTGPLADVLKLSKAMFIFALTAVAVGFFVKQFAIGALGLIAGMTAIGLVVTTIYGSSRTLQGSANLRHVSFSLAIFVASLLAYALLVQPKLTWEGIGMLGAVIGVMGLVGMILGIPPIDKWTKAGAASLVTLGVSLIVFSVGLAIYAQLAAPKLTWMNIAMMGAVIAGLAVAAGLMGAYELGLMTGIPGTITLGAILMVALGIALITFSIGLSIYAQLAAPTLTFEKVGILAAVIGVMALIGTVLGVVAPLAILGSVALVMIGAAMLPLTLGLAIFANSGWKREDGENLKYALHNIILGMFGYENMSDIGVSAIVWIPSLVGFLLLTSAAFVVAAAAMLPLSMALMIFKATKWEFADSLNLQFTLSSIANAFATIAQGDNWFNTMLGIFAMRDVGGTLISLAAGIQAMANMTFTEYEWDETTKRLEPKRKVKLTRDDVKLAADNAAYVISVLADPLAKFGKAVGENQGPPGSVFEAFFSGGKNYMIMGINALGSLGTGLVSLAAGVQDWASMSYWEYDLVYNPKTQMQELRPIKKRKITPGEIQEAITNIATTITAMIVPVAAFGIMMAGGAMMGGPLAALGITKNPIEKGLDGLATLGKSIVSLATGVRDWATMAYWEYGIVVNPKTGMPELVPIAKKKLTPKDIDLAIDNIARVMSAMMVPVADFGIMMAGGAMMGGPLAALGITKNPIEKGIEAIGNLGKSIAGVADGVLKFASMQFVEWEVQKVNGKNELVPGRIVKVDETIINTAIDNIGLVLSAGARAVIAFEKETGSGGAFSGFTVTLTKISTMTNAFGKVYEEIRKLFADGKSLGIVMDNFRYFFEHLFKPMDLQKTMQMLLFNTQFERYINNTLELSKKYTKLDMSLKDVLVVKYDYFTKVTERLAKIATPFERFVKAFGDMAKHMGVFATNFKVMTPEGISSFKDWTDSMVEISKVDIAKSDGIIKFVNDTVSAAFGGGKSDKVAADKSPQSYSEADKTNQLASMKKQPGMTESGGGQQAQAAPIDTNAIVNAIQQGFSNITVDNMTVINMQQ